MLPTTRTGDGDPTIVLLHLFGSSKREWTECAEILSKGYQCIAIDLPGFGDAADVLGYTVELMAHAVEQTLRGMGLLRFMLVGHSLSGKVAMAIAARCVVEPIGLLLIAPSPPSPEPIPGEARAKMLAMTQDRASAEVFLDGITAQPLTGNVRERAVEDFIEASPAAWRAWLENGSEEDWVERIGILSTPALIITGTADPTLGAETQERTTLKSFHHAQIQIIANCGHLPTMEKPDELTRLMRTFVESLTS